jgi:biopolymer transport protein TolR
MSEINLTPMMDLSFILLITFIITFPMIEQGIAVNLPKGDARDLDPKQARTITIDRIGKLYLDNNALEIEELEKRMTGLGRVMPEVSIMVRADKGIEYGRVVEVLRILHHAGLTNMALITEAE